MGIEINGVAHVILTVSDFSAARAFYGKLLPLMGMTAVCDTDKFFRCIGGPRLLTPTARPRSRRIRWRSAARTPASHHPAF